MNDNIHVAVYNEIQSKLVNEHIAKYYGHVETVFHEFFSPDIHVDIMLIKPTQERNYNTIITVGMGAHPMTVPERLRSQGFDRAELIMCLPPTWDFQGNNKRSAWPCELLRFLARLPIQEHTWLGYGHSVPNGEAYADNTQLSGCLLLGIQDAPEGASICCLPDDERVIFYQVIPLCDGELKYNAENGTDDMLKHMEDLDPVVDIGRPDIFLSLKTGRGV